MDWLVLVLVLDDLVIMTCGLKMQRWRWQVAKNNVAKL